MNPMNKEMKDTKAFQPGKKSNKDLDKEITPCCGPAPASEDKPYWACGTVSTSAGTVTQIKTAWSGADRRGEIKSRISAFRMKYIVPPDIYAVGTPGRSSEVFASANYKLSFDKLRHSLTSMSAWILVLDTKGINVWCASGKGTFGTKELIKRIHKTRLNSIVDHRRIIVPQFAAVGVNAKEVKEQTGFRVFFGPVYARDIPEYVKAKYIKNKVMSTVRFTLGDRIVLTPMEINPAVKNYYPWFALIVLVLFGIQPSGILFRNALRGGFPFLVLGLVSIFAGAFLTPVLLPFVPFRSFAVKGWIMGILSTYLAIHFLNLMGHPNGILLVLAYLFFPLASSYIALQFTGSTTYTGISGVVKELKIALPVYITGTVLSLVLIVVFKITQWRGM